MFDFIKANRIHILRATAVGLVLFSNSIYDTYPFPYLYQIVQGYGLATNNAEVGFYGGLLGGIAYAGRGLTCVHWGKLADTKGRIPTLMIALCLVTICCILFNYSTTILSGLLLRFLIGATVAGLLVVGRVMMTEIVPPRLKATSISIASSIWMMGTAVALFVGGYFVNYFPTSPYLMITIILCVLFIVNVLTAKFVLVETLNPREENALEGPRAEILVELLEVKSRKDTFEMAIIDKNAPPAKTKENGSEWTAKFGKSNQTGFDQDQVQPTYEKYHQNPKVIRGIIAFSTTMFFETILTETLPLWLCVPYAQGGLQMDASQIGRMMGIIGILQFFLQITVYPLLEKSFQNSTILIGSGLATIPFFVLIPLAHDLFSLESAISMQLFVIATCVLGLFMISLTLAALQHVLNDSVPTNQRGEMNGALTMGNSVTQGLAPVVGGALIQWSVNSGFGFPFNHHFLFVFCALGCVLNLYFTSGKTFDKNYIQKKSCVSAGKCSENL